MIYLLGVILPVAFQLLVIVLVIVMNTGNGSWLGLGAFLLGIFVVPATAMANFFYVRARRQQSESSVLMPCFLLALIVPLLVAMLLLLG